MSNGLLDKDEDESSRFFTSLSSKFSLFRSGVVVIAYSSEDGQKFGELRGDIGAVRCVLIPSFRKPRSPLPKKRTLQPRDAFEDTAFKPGFEIVKF
jgi:hypothetical protein